MRAVKRLRYGHWIDMAKRLHPTRAILLPSRDDYTKLYIAAKRLGVSVVSERRGDGRIAVKRAA